MLTSRPFFITINANEATDVDYFEGSGTGYD